MVLTRTQLDGREFGSALYSLEKGSVFNLFVVILFFSISI